jgi:hypothetical protein
VFFAEQVLAERMVTSKSCEEAKLIFPESVTHFSDRSERFAQTLLPQRP